MSRYTLIRQCIFLVWFFVVGAITAQQEKPMVIVIPSYNNMAWYQKNLDSVFFQNYSNYRVIYVDDQSPDGTGQLVQDYLEKNGLQDKCLLIKNEVRYGQLFNRYKAIHACDDDEIIVLLDGDDWLKHDNVLAYLNEIYTQETVFLTVGNACKSATGQKLGYRDYTDQEIEHIGFRQLGFRGVHPRTFYAGLFKKIKAQDLIHRGKFLMVATDVAFMLPMFEMARDNYKYIHDLLYVYNNENPINLYKSKFERQIYFDLLTRNRKPYQKLETTDSFITQKINYPELTHLIFMEEEENAEDFFRRQKEDGIQFDSCIKVGNGDPYRRTRRRDYFKRLYTLDIGYPLSKIYHFRFNFKQRLLETLECCGGDYLLISTHKMLSNDTINLTECINQLEATGASGVMLGKSDGQFLKEQSYDVAPWGSDTSLYLFNLWAYPQVFREMSDCYGMVFRKSDFIDLVNKIEIFHPNYYTLLSACNSVMREDSLLLVTHVIQEGAGDDEK